MSPHMVIGAFSCKRLDQFDRIYFAFRQSYFTYIYYMYSRDFILFSKGQKLFLGDFDFLDIDVDGFMKINV